MRQSPTDLAKIAEAQADRIEVVIESLLKGLGLSAEQYERGRTIAYEALRAQTVERWEPLWAPDDAPPRADTMACTARLWREQPIRRCLPR